MMHSKIPLSQTVVQLCKAKDIEHIVISPGSRNAPLTIGFTHDDFFKCYSIVDERCAAFFALGIVQQTGKPAAVVCTSGSALLNYYPAVAEAFYSYLPLIVISADRPEYLIGIGDGQTINQQDVFSHHIQYSANLKQDLKEKISNTDDIPIFKSLENKLEKVLGMQKTIQQENEMEINKALNTAINEKGPVHLNVPFEEPLYDKVDKLSVNPQILNAVSIPEQQTEIDKYRSKWSRSKKKMLLVGANRPNFITREYLKVLEEDESIVVFTETTSNLHSDKFFPNIDKIIAPLTDNEFSQLQPDILLTLGGLVVSKKIKAFLRAYKPKEHWHVDTKKANDTFFCLTAHFKTDVNSFFKEFFRGTNTVKSDYRNHWLKVKHFRRKMHNQYMEKISFSDFLAFDHILQSLPDFSNVQVGNSSAIRYTQLFELNKTLKVYCNRGTSGIDGSTSTAIGSSIIAKNQTIFITGDLSFFYDSNALWNDYIPNNFRIILINNQGGGIFRILPGHKNTENFDIYFETKHNLTALQLCDMYGFNYLYASNEKELKKELSHFYKKSSKPQLLEIFTPRTVNDSVLLDYFEFIK